MSAMTLTCDATAKPVGLIPLRDAVARVASSLVHDECGEVQVLISDEERRFRSQYLDIPSPMVILDPGYVELDPRATERVSRRVLIARDGFRCQYCGYRPSPGKAMRELTVDHVKPVHMFSSRAAATTWDNVVAACRSCNTRKGGRLPVECGMMPACVPSRPHYVQLRFAGRLNAVQRDYVKDYYGERIAGGL